MYICCDWTSLKEGEGTAGWQEPGEGLNVCLPVSRTPFESRAWEQTQAGGIQRAVRF